MGNTGWCGVPTGAECDRLTILPHQEYVQVDGGDASEFVDPAGAVFPETHSGLELPEIDRLFLSFAGGNNVSAVRWMLRCGADRHAVDANGTACLHAACRSGSRAVIKELCMEGNVLAQDKRGWTPLHVAVVMGRRDIVAFLLSAKADPTARNARGQLPIDLCFSKDTAMKRALQYQEGQPPVKLQDMGSARLMGAEGETPRAPVEDTRFEPFFVPNTPFMAKPENKEVMEALGIRFFNANPGRGIAFLVATGCVRDFPIQISLFLQRAPVDPAQVSAIVGSPYSLSQILLVEFINASRMYGMGVVSALLQVFDRLKCPSELTKLDRICQAIARIWWRHHERPNAGANARKKAAREFNVEEVMGEELKARLTSPEAMHMLLFSCVLLHWSAHDSGSQSARTKISFEQWASMNKGFDNGKDVPTDIQEKLFRALTTTHFPQLVIEGPASPVNWTPRTPRGKAPLSQADLFTPACRAFAGWVELTDPGRALGGSLAKRLSSLIKASVLGETCGSGLRKTSTQVQRIEGSDRLWLTLAHGLAFLSLDEEADPCPVAFFQLSHVICTQVDQSSKTISLAGRASEERPSGTDTQLAILLADGRFQVMSMGTLKLRPESNFDDWGRRFQSAGASPLV